MRLKIRDSAALAQVETLQRELDVTQQTLSSERGAARQLGARMRATAAHVGDEAAVRRDGTLSIFRGTAVLSRVFFRPLAAESRAGWPTKARPLLCPGRE